MFYRFYLELNKPKSFAAREAILHDLDDPHAQANLQDDRFPHFKPKFEPLLLTEESSLVDFVDDGSATGGLGLLVSTKALSVLEKLKLPPHRSYPLVTKHKGKEIKDQYHWLQILLTPYEDWIDFSKSEFQLKGQFEMDDDAKGEDVTIKNAAELKKIISTLGENDQDLLFSKLALNEEYKQQGFDIFFLDRLDGIRAVYPIVTERFKNAIEENRLVGYRLKKVPISA